MLSIHDVGSGDSFRFIDARFLRLLAFLACALLCGVNAGCGKPAGVPAALQGTVKLGGKPIEKGAIRFSTEDGTPGPGAVGLIHNGQYQIKIDAGLKVGKYLVMIYGFKATGRMIKIDENTPERKEELQFVPRRYNDDSQEHLELEPGDNTKDFELTK